MNFKKRFFALAIKHRLAVCVVFFEALASAIFVAVGIALNISDWIIRPEIFTKRITGYLALDAIFLLATLMFFFIARQLMNRKRWARSAAVFAQLIQIAIAWNSFTGDPLGWFIGTWLIVTSAAGLYFLFSKDVIGNTKEQVERD